MLTLIGTRLVYTHQFVTLGGGEKRKNKEGVCFVGPRIVQIQVRLLTVDLAPRTGLS